MKKPMTIRLEEGTLKKLSILASKSGINRQDLVEKILVEASKEIKEDFADIELSYVPSQVLESIKKQSDQLYIGKEISLKQLVGDKQWSSFTDATRRVFGKQFKDMVIDGDFPRLKVGRKKSNNEQQYVVQE